MNGKIRAMEGALTVDLNREIADVLSVILGRNAKPNAVPAHIYIYEHFTAFCFPSISFDEAKEMCREQIEAAKTFASLMRMQFYAGDIFDKIRERRLRMHILSFDSRQDDKW